MAGNEIRMFRDRIENIRKIPARYRAVIYESYIEYTCTGVRPAETGNVFLDALILDWCSDYDRFLEKVEKGRESASKGIRASAAAAGADEPSVKPRSRRARRADAPAKDGSADEAAEASGADEVGETSDDSDVSDEGNLIKEESLPRDAAADEEAPIPDEPDMYDDAPIPDEPVTSGEAPLPDEPVIPDEQNHPSGSVSRVPEGTPRVPEGTQRVGEGTPYTDTDTHTVTNTGTDTGTYTHTLSCSPSPPGRGCGADVRVSSVREADEAGAREDRFARFWEKNPRKIHRADAYRQFRIIKPGDELLRTMLDSISLYEQSDEWKRDKGRFIPGPDKWLSDKAWKYPPKRSGGGFMESHDDWNRILFG